MTKIQGTAVIKKDNQQVDVGTHINNIRHGFFLEYRQGQIHRLLHYELGNLVSPPIHFVLNHSLPDDGIHINRSLSGFYTGNLVFKWWCKYTYNMKGQTNETEGFFVDGILTGIGKSTRQDGEQSIGEF
jgi:hypothetical protein